MYVLLIGICVMLDGIPSDCSISVDTSLYASAADCAAERIELEDGVDELADPDRRYRLECLEVQEDSLWDARRDASSRSTTDF